MGEIIENLEAISKLLEQEPETVTEFADRCRECGAKYGKLLKRMQQPCEDCISRADAIKALEYNLSVEADGGLDKYRTVIKGLLNAIYNTQKKAIESLPSIQPKTGHWNNHQIACMLADLFGDACACNYNGIDEWLSELCDFKDTCCPNPVGVACWEQFLKHRAESEEQQ